MRIAITAAIVACCVAAPIAQDTKGYDELLDTYVRDGEVYYRALKSDRGKLDAFINQVGGANVDRLSRDEKVAFWINAYNAIVLRTIIDHYPITGKSAQYPPKSIRQIPGAFERTAHRVAGRTVTLDQIEQTILPEFHDPRVYFALGRGAMGSGRLRSEALRRSAAGEPAHRSCRTNASPGSSAFTSTERDQQGGRLTRFFRGAKRSSSTAYADTAPARPSPHAVRSSARCSPSCSPKLLTTEKEFLAAKTLPGRLQAVRLDAQRPHRPWRR